MGPSRLERLLQMNLHFALMRQRRAEDLRTESQLLLDVELHEA